MAISRRLFAGIAILLARPAAVGAAPAAYRPTRPGTVATYQVTGTHGKENDPKRKRLDGVLTVVAFESDGQGRAVLAYQPESREVLLGCPMAFCRIGADGRLTTEPEIHVSFATKLLLDLMFPAGLAAGGESVVDELKEVTVLEVRVPVNLKVQTVPDREGSGWMRTEALARESDETALPPGKGRVTAWEAKYVVDGEGTLSLVETRYAARITDQGNMVIAIDANVARTGSRPVSASEAGTLGKDVLALLDVAQDWKLNRGKAREKLDRWAAGSSASVFSPYVPFLSAHLAAEIERFGEKSGPFYWRPPGVRDGRLPPKKPTDAEEGKGP